MRGDGNISLGLNHLLKNYVHYLYDQGTKLAKREWARRREGPPGDNPSRQPFAGNTSQKRENRKDKAELEEATGLTLTSEMIRIQIQDVEVPGKILLC